MSGLGERIRYLGAGLKKLWYMMLTTAWSQLLFAYGAVLQLVEIVFGIASYFFLTKIFQGTSAVMESYGTDVVSFIVLGLAMNSILRHSLTGVYHALNHAYATRALERVLMSPTSVYMLVFSQMASGYIRAGFVSTLYLFAGVLFFGVSLGRGDAASVFAALALGTVATLGLGMLLSALFFYTSVGKVDPATILILATAVSNTFTGAVFPVEVLRYYAPWLYPFSLFLPQTHAIFAARMALNGVSLADPAVAPSVAYLIAVAAVTIPIGYRVIRRGLDRIRREGYTPSVAVMVD